MRIALSLLLLVAPLLSALGAAPVATNIANFPSVSVAYTNYIAEGIVTNGLTLGGVRNTTWPAGGSAPTNTAVWTGSAPAVGDVATAADITGTNIIWAMPIFATNSGFAYPAQTNAVKLIGDGVPTLPFYGGINSLLWLEQDTSGPYSIILSTKNNTNSWANIFHDSGYHLYLDSENADSQYCLIDIFAGGAVSMYGTVPITLDVSGSVKASEAIYATNIINFTGSAPAVGSVLTAGDTSGTNGVWSAIPGITTTWTNIVPGVITQRISTVSGIIVTNLTL